MGTGRSRIVQLPRDNGLVALGGHIAPYAAINANQQQKQLMPQAKPFNNATNLLNAKPVSPPLSFQMPQAIPQQKHPIKVYPKPYPVPQPYPVPVRVPVPKPVQVKVPVPKIQRTSVLIPVPVHVDVPVPVPVKVPQIVKIPKLVHVKVPVPQPYPVQINVPQPYSLGVGAKVDCCNQSVDTVPNQCRKSMNVNHESFETTHLNASAKQDCDCTVTANQCSCASIGKMEKIDSIIENLNKKLNKSGDVSNSNMSHFGTSLNGTTATTATNSTGIVKFQQPSKSILTSTVMNTEVLQHPQHTIEELNEISPSSSSSSLTESHLNINHGHLNTSALSSASSSASSIKDQYSPIKELKKSSQEYATSPSVHFNTTTNFNTITNVSPTNNTKNNNSPQLNVTLSPVDDKTLDLQKSFASAINANYHPTSNSSNPAISTSRLTEMYSKNFNSSNEKSSTNSMTAVSNNRSSYRLNAPTSLVMTESHKPYPSINTSSLARPISKGSLKSNGSSTNASSVSSETSVSSRGSSASRNIYHDQPSPAFNDPPMHHYRQHHGGALSPSVVHSQHTDLSSNLSKKTSPPSSVTKASFPSSATFNNSISTIKTSYPSYGYSNSNSTNNNNKNNNRNNYQQIYSDYYRD